MDDGLASSKRSDLGLKYERSVEDERSSTNVALRDLVTTFSSLKYERSVEDKRSSANVALRDLIATFGNGWGETLAGL